MGWRWKAWFLFAMFALASMAWFGASRLSRARDSKESSRTALGQILSSRSVDSMERLLSENRPALLPDDRLLARLHLAVAREDSTDIFRLIDSARSAGLAPAESLDAWRATPRATALAQRLALLDFDAGDLDAPLLEADSCLARDSTLLACHLAGAMAAALDRNWQNFEARTERALRIHPGDFRLQGFHGIALLLDGDIPRAAAWIPDARYRAQEPPPLGRLSMWSSRLFQPWRQAIQGTASDSLLSRLPLTDSLRAKLAGHRDSAQRFAARPDGFVACMVAPNTYGAIHVCRPQEGVPAYPQLGSDTAALPRTTR